MDFLYDVGDELFYVCPFTFTIERVKIEFVYEFDDGEIGYVEQTGAYLREVDLCEKIEDAKELAYQRLDAFYAAKSEEIYYCDNPEMLEE